MRRRSDQHESEYQGVHRRVLPGYLGGRGTLAVPGPAVYGRGMDRPKPQGTRLPRSRGLRIALGVGLLLGGVLGFLPVVGFWMLPLGLLVLSVDIPWVRRGRRRVAVWWGRRQAKKRG